MTTNLEDGIYYGTWNSGEAACVFLSAGRISCDRDELVGGSSWPVEGHFKPLRRIADLAGRPVVDEGVIEAIVDAWFCKGDPTTDPGHLTRILKSHLCPSQQEAVEGEQKQHSCSIASEALAALAAAGIATPEKGYVKDPSASVGSDIKQLAAERDRLKARIAELEQDATAAKRYLADLFKHYAPQCEPMDSLGGLISQIDNCMVGMRDRIRELEAAPTTNRYLETATGDEWVFLPENCEQCRVGLRLRDRSFDAYESGLFAARFTPLPPAEATRGKTSAPSREWLLKMADAEDRTGSVSVGGLAVELGLNQGECDTCGCGSILPSGKCDHCNSANQSIPPAEADAPIVDLRKFGAFPCWFRRDSGEKHTAWRVAVVTNGFHNVTVRCKDGRTDLHTDQYFAANFTRQRPLTLPPEHEKLIQPIVARFGMDAGELRGVIAKVGV